jgi:pimeloyl-ACP methyl ester carboxylesterase
VPTLFIAGGADLAAPPTMMRMVAGHVPGADMVVMSDVGHSGYWEQPEAFNRIVLDFIGRQSKQ